MGVQLDGTKSGWRKEHGFLVLTITNNLNHKKVFSVIVIYFTTIWKKLLSFHSDILFLIVFSLVQVQFESLNTFLYYFLFRSLVTILYFQAPAPESAVSVIRLNYITTTTNPCGKMYPFRREGLTCMNVCIVSWKRISEHDECT